MTYRIEEIEITAEELKPSDSYGIAAMMSQIPGWERTERIRRQPLYGRQRLYALTYGG